MAIPTAGGYDSATISNPDSALTDFTLIVDLSRMSSDWWSDVNTTDGTRGRASKSDGSTELACDWIDFDDTEETGLLRVKYSGTLASTGTQTIRIYPPNTRNTAYSTSDTYGSDNAYNSDWVIYSPDGGVGNRIGSDGTAYGGVSSGGTTGLLGAATTYDGSDDYVRFSNDMPTGDWTIAALADADISVAQTSAIVGTYEDRRIVLKAEQWQNTGNVGVTYGGVGDYDSGTACPSSEDVIIAASDISTNIIDYNIGTSAAQNTSVTAPEATTNDIVIGAANQFSDWYTGSVSHVSVHSTCRSSAWRAEERDQLRDNATFWGTWSWTSLSGGDSLTASDITSGTPSIESSNISQRHALTSKDIISGTVTIEAANIGQNHALIGKVILSSVPVITKPTVGTAGADILAAKDILSGLPVIEAPILRQLNELFSKDISAGVPYISKPTVDYTFEAGGGIVKTIALYLLHKWIEEEEENG